MSQKRTLTKSQEYSESIVDTVREPLIVLDQDLRVVTASRSFYEVFKVKPAETVGQLIYNLGNKQWDIPKLRELLEDILPQKATFDDYEVEHNFIGIGRRIMLLNARRIPSPPEKPKVILLAIEDITKRKSREEAYLSLAAIVNTSVDGIIGETLQGNIVSWNKGAEKIYGYTKKEMQSQNITLLAPPGYKKEMLNQLKKLRAGELIENHETKRVRKDGVVIDISLTLSSIKDKLGNICGVSAIMHDITEQKTAKQVLIASEYSESIINTVREPLIVLDQDLRVVTVSRSFYEFFKVKPEETVGQLIYDLGNKQWNIPKLRELLETILPQKTTFDNYEVEHDFATIGRRIMLLNARQIERGLGKERIILLAIEDITERKEIEDGLETTRKELVVIKKSADEASEFAESVINTVREPLISLDQDLRVVAVSRSFYEFFKVKPEETIGQLIYDLGNKQWNIPKLRELLETILPQKTTFDNYEVEHDFATIGRRIMLLNARQIERGLGKERIILLAIEDITERRKLEEAHNNLAAIVEFADDAIIGEDLEGIIVSWNKGAEVIYGYNAKEIVGQSISLLMSPDHPDEYKAVLAKITHGEALKHYETQRRRKDGQIKDISLTISPVKDTSRNIIGASSIARDITVRREIENGLEKTRKELAVIKKSADEASEFAESVINTVRESLISLDQDLRVVAVSRSFYEFFKVKPEETVGQLIYDLGNKQWNIPKLRELLETILPQKTTFDNYEVEHNFATIGRRIMLLNARQIERGLGKERIILLAIEDITERKEIEDGLEKTRKELAVIKKSADEASEFAESVINTVREPLISLDQDLRVVTVSRSFYEFFKVKPEETVGQLIYDLGNKQWNIPKLRELLETILPQKTTFDNYEVEHDFATIGRRIMLLNARQIERGLGKERIILLAIEDITERKEIETGLEKAHEELTELAAELKRVARAKSEFLANMSHELRTPLNSINGFSEVLYDETFGPLNEKQKKYANNILTSGKHLLLLINQILDMAKVESGKMKLALSVLPVKSLLNDISMLVADMVSKKKIEMLLEIADDLPNIEADELKVKEIIYNLLSNAVKFTPEGGKLGIRAKKVDSEIEVVVWDTGVGIASENMGKIFEGFFRVDTPYSRVTEGTGLGLPLSKKLVELHGGKLYVESGGLNKGTSVRFTLPIVSRKVV